EGIINQFFGTYLHWRCNCGRVAQRLRSDPVLAIRTVEITTQHPETVCQSSRISMEKWFLLNGIALQSSNIVPGHIERSTTIESYLAHTGQTIGNGAAMSTGETAYAVAVQFLVEFTGTNVLIDDVP